jgi:hypothetical protein
MILLQENTANIVVLTLTEKTTINAPTYLFRFVNKQTNVEYVCIATDTSTFKQRYNKFTITTQSTTPNPLLGQLKLSLGDEYEYYIYAQVSTTNLDYKLANEMVETGIMRYDKTLTDRIIFTNGTTTRKVFGA